jgi:hypothetical protein
MIPRVSLLLQPVERGVFARTDCLGTADRGGGGFGRPGVREGTGRLLDSGIEELL